MNVPSEVTAAAPLSDGDLQRLQACLEAVPPPLEPLDIMALDGYLCGVLLQPTKVPAGDWMRFVVDVEGRALPAGIDTAALQALVQRRHAELDHAIARRDWFDPWVFELDEAASVADSVLPWVAGFATAMDAFPSLMNLDHPELVEPLALLYMHFDPDDLEDADALVAVIETLEPPADLAEAVQDLVRSLMLIADVSRPRASRPGPPKARRPHQPRKRR